MVRQRAGQPLLRLSSPWRFWRRALEVRAADGEALGVVRKGYAFMRTRYEVFDARERRLFVITAGVVRTRTFGVRRDGADGDSAVITRRWAAFSAHPLESSHRYELEFAQIHSPIERAMLLGALFFIDFQEFGSGSGD